MSLTTAFTLCVPSSYANYLKTQGPNERFVVGMEPEVMGGIFTRAGKLSISSIAFTNVHECTFGCEHLDVLFLQLSCLVSRHQISVNRGASAEHDQRA
jgi:hypothetical protein